MCSLKKTPGALQRVFLFFLLPISPTSSTERINVFGNVNDLFLILISDEITVDARKVQLKRKCLAGCVIVIMGYAGKWRDKAFQWQQCMLQFVLKPDFIILDFRLWLCIHWNPAINKDSGNQCPESLEVASCKQITQETLLPLFYPPTSFSTALHVGLP